MLLISYQYLPIEEWVGRLKDNAESLGAVGWVIYIIIYAIATLILAPASVLTLAAGFIYGLEGFFIVIIGAIIGASLSFLAGRYIFKNKVENFIATKPKLNSIDKAVEAEGWKIVALCRLSPLIPFNLQNWFFGVTSISFKSYFLSSFFAIMPGTLLYIWIGSLGSDIADNENTSIVKTIFLIIGLIATFVVTFYIGKKARQKLDEIA
jgi:uncharacterized membrane protein YdjX (TVP38/TMEM64 family)